MDWLTIAGMASGWAGTAIASVVAWRYKTKADAKAELATERAAALVTAEQTRATLLAAAEERRKRETDELREAIRKASEAALDASVRHEAKVKGLLAELAAVEADYAKNPAAARLRLVRLLQGTTAADYSGA